MLQRRLMQRRALAAVAAAAAAETAQPPWPARTGRQLHLRLQHRQGLMAHSMHAAGSACVTQPLAVSFVCEKPSKSRGTRAAAAGSACVTQPLTVSLTCDTPSKSCGTQAAAAGGPPAAPAAAPRGEGSLDIPAARVTTLQGHTNEVFICAWSPTAPLLASG